MALILYYTAQKQLSKTIVLKNTYTDTVNTCIYCKYFNIREGEKEHERMRANELPSST